MNGCRKRRPESVAGSIAGRFLRAQLLAQRGAGATVGVARPEYYDFDLFGAFEQAREFDDRPLAFDTEPTELDLSQGDEIIQNFGASSGEPRQEADPVRQARDYRDVITHVTTMPELDASRIGVWGTSYSGGHVLHVAAYDRRVKCVVAQVPTISGFEQARRRVAPAQVAAGLQAFATERSRRARGEAPTMRAVVAERPGQACVFDGDDATAYFRAAAALAPAWRNEVTLGTLEMSREYEPAAHIERISPTPLLMIVATDDVVTPTDLALDAYSRAREPKRLVLLEGGHFDPYTTPFERAADAASEWFATHLAAHPPT